MVAIENYAPGYVSIFGTVYSVNQKIQIDSILLTADMKRHGLTGVAVAYTIGMSQSNFSKSLTAGALRIKSLFDVCEIMGEDPAKYLVCEYKEEEPVEEVPEERSVADNSELKEELARIGENNKKIVDELHTLAEEFHALNDTLLEFAKIFKTAWRLPNE